AGAGGLDDAAAVLGNGWIDELDPMGLETRERPRLVDLHQPTVADHVSRDDRCEPALWSRHIHPLDSSARILADARLLPKLVMTFAGPWFAQQPPEGASNGECPILPIPYDGSNVWLNQPIICGTGGRHASHGHRNLHRRHARPCHQAEHEPPVRGERAV